MSFIGFGPKRVWGSASLELDKQSKKREPSVGHWLETPAFKSKMKMRMRMMKKMKKKKKTKMKKKKMTMMMNMNMKK